MSKYVLLILATSLIGCSGTLSTKECVGMNWLAKGKEDAEKGTNISEFYNYSNTCAKINVEVDEEKYVKGYQIGQKLVCVYENGLKIGRKGGNYNEACPETSKYYEGYVAGRKEFDRERELRQIENLTRPNPNPAGNPGGPE